MTESMAISRRERSFRAAIRPSPRRRRAAAVLLAIGAAMVAVAVLLAVDPGRYVVLLPVSIGVVMGVAGVAFALAGVAAGITLRGDWRTGLVTVCAVTAVVTGAWPVRALADDYGPVDGPTVVERSDDGRFTIVRVRWNERGEIQDRYHVESNEGWRSRHSRYLVVRGSINGEAYAGPAIETVRFVGETRIEIRTVDGRVWTTTFSPDSVSVGHRLGTCGEPGYLCLRPAG